MIQNADFIVPVEIDGTVHNVYVIKRPGVDEFMRQMGLIYEVVVFTASLSKYADPVLDMLDIHTAVRHRLFRESCYNHKGNYVKDLSQLGRDIGDTIIIDNSPASYIFHPNNAVPISSWFNDPHDTELTDLCPFLADLAGVDDEGPSSMVRCSDKRIPTDDDVLAISLSFKFRYDDIHTQARHSFFPHVRTASTIPMTDRRQRNV